MRAIAYEVVLVSGFLLAAGCGASADPMGSATSQGCPPLDATSDTASDAANDAAPDAANDAAPDAASDAAPDAGNDADGSELLRDATAQPDAAIDRFGGDAASELTAHPDARMDALPDRVTTAPDAAPGCLDNRKNGTETDIDCGGSCPACGLGQGCLVDSDCGSWPGCDVKKGGCSCDTSSQKCVVDYCVDHHQNMGETAVDCGGGECPACAVGQACILDSDCSSSACDTLAMTCSASRCSDHHKDGSETNVDCGGGQCPGCALGQHCSLDLDCASMACDGISGTCDPDPCADNHVDGNETDVDCGGTDCPSRCAPYRKCIVSSDCTPGHVCSATVPHLCN